MCDFIDMEICRHCAPPSPAEIYATELLKTPPKRIMFVLCWIELFNLTSTKNTIFGPFHICWNMKNINKGPKIGQDFVAGVSGGQKIITGNTLDIY